MLRGPTGFIIYHKPKDWNSLLNSVFILFSSVTNPIISHGTDSVSCYYGVIVTFLNMLCDDLPLFLICGTKHLHPHGNVPHFKNCANYLVTLYF